MDKGCAPSQQICTNLCLLLLKIGFFDKLVTLRKSSFSYRTTHSIFQQWKCHKLLKNTIENRILQSNVFSLERLYFRSESR